MIPPLRFGSKIIVVSPKAFEKMPLNDMTSHTGEYSGSTWTLEERVRHKKRGWTMGARDCCAGGFQNGLVTLFHINPQDYADERGFKKVAAALTQDARQAAGRNSANGTPTLRGLLSGGWHHFYNSATLHERLSTLFSSLNIPHSVLWGNRQGRGTDLFYSADNDRWIVTSRRWDRQNLAASTALLKDTFAKIQIAPGDELYLGDESHPVDPKDVNQDLPS